MLEGWQSKSNSVFIKQPCDMGMTQGGLSFLDRNRSVTGMSQMIFTFTVLSFFALVLQL